MNLLLVHPILYLYIYCIAFSISFQNPKPIFRVVNSLFNLRFILKDDLYFITIEKVLK